MPKRECQRNYLYLLSNFHILWILCTEVDFEKENNYLALKCLTWKVTQYICKGLELLTRVQLLMNHEPKIGPIINKSILLFARCKQQNLKVHILNFASYNTHHNLVKWIQLWGMVLDTLMVFVANTYWQIPFICWQH